MSDFPFDAIGLDLDGTLLDTKGDLAAAVNHALAQGGYDRVPAGAVESMIGGGAKVMLARAIESQGGSMADEDFRPLYKTLFGCGWPEAAALALDTFKANRSFYHPIAAKMLAKDLGLE